METSDRPKEISTSSYGWLLFFLNVFATAYILALEIMPPSFSQELTALYNTKKSTITYLLSFYYYALIVFQIPAGLLIDKYKTRLLLTSSIALAGLGMILFSQSAHLFTVMFSRLLMGIGSAFTFLHSVKCIADWFPKKFFTIRFGLFLALELFVTLAFSSFFNSFAVSSGWRHASFLFGITGIAFAVIAFFMMKSFKEKHELYLSEKKISFKPLLRKLFDSSQMWVIGLTIGLPIGVFYVFLGGWATSLFTLAYSLSKTDAVIVILVANIGYACGSLFFTYLSTLLKKRKLLIPWAILVAIFIIVCIIYPPYLGSYFLTPMLFLLGFAIASVNLGYVIIHEQNAPQITATAIASVNTFYAIVVAALDTVITNFLQFETSIRGTTTAIITDLEAVLIRLPIYFSLALIFSFFIRETYGNQQTSAQHEQ